MNTLFGFGSNGSGQLGLGHLDDVNTPQICIGIPKNEVIKKVVGGGNHSAALTMSGRLFLTGSSQLGSQQQKKWENAVSSSAQNDYNWTIYKEPYPQHKWHDVACGWAFTILVDDSGKVFGVGSSAFGELGIVSKQDISKLCTIGADLLVNIESVTCGWRHCVALDCNGKAYGWGWGKHGQFGVQLEQEKPTAVYRPFIIPTPEPMTQAACGHLHTLFLGAHTGKVYGCGLNKNGQVGASNGTTHVRLLTHCGQPTDATDGSGDAQRRLTAGWHHSAVLSRQGNLNMWGKNDHGQLQDGLPNVTNIMSGSEHSLALLDNGHVISWGWNEHGNCTTDKNMLLTPVTVDPPAENCNITILGAGCATSWIGLLPSC